MGCCASAPDSDLRDQAREGEDAAGWLFKRARSSDGLLEATIAKGRGRKPSWMLWFPIRNFHTIIIIAMCALYMMHGPPAEQQCVVSMYLARAFVVVALIMANGALN